MNKEVCEGFKSARGHCTSIGKDISLFYFYLLLLRFYFLIFILLLAQRKKSFFIICINPSSLLCPFLPTFPYSFPFHSPEKARQIAPRKDQGPHHYTQIEQGIHPEKTDSKKPVKAGITSLGTTASGPAISPRHTAVTHIRECSFVLC